MSNSILGTLAVAFDHTWMQQNHVLPFCSCLQLTAGLCWAQRVQSDWGACPHITCAGGHLGDLLLHPSVLAGDVSGETYGAAAVAADSAFCWLYKQPYGVYFLISECLSRLFEHYFNMGLFCFFVLNGVFIIHSCIYCAFSSTVLWCTVHVYLSLFEIRYK